LKPKLVSEWERGEKRPSGPSLKLFSIVKAKGLDAIAQRAAQLLAYWWSMIFSENRYPLFGIML